MKSTVTDWPNEDIFCYLFSWQVLMFHTQEPLRDDYSLMDIAYIYTWRRVISTVIA